MAGIDLEDLPPDVAETVRLRAELSGLSLSEYVRQQLISQARQRRKSEALDAVEAALDKSPGTALAALPALIESRYPHTGRLADGAWELRHTITFYDGLCVALATVLELPLLTADAKLANAPGLSREVELIG